MVLYHIIMLIHFDYCMLFHCMYILFLPIHFLNDGYLSSFQVFAVANSVALDILGWYTCVTTSMSGIAGP